jgi:hypothetical protein
MYVAEQGTQHGNFKPMNCQSFVREEDIKVGRRLKIAQLHTWHIQKEGTRMHNPVYPISATSCQGNKIWHYDNWEHLRIQRETRRGQQVHKDQSHNLAIEETYLYYKDLGFSNTESFSPQIQISLHTMT